MTDAELAAIASIRLSWAPTRDDVWKSQHDIHVSGLQDNAFSDILAALDDAIRSDGPSPIGVALRGPAGSGKTHLLSRVREAAQERGGYFFLIELLEGKSFWRSTLTHMLDDLLRPTPAAPSQLQYLIDTLAVQTEVAGSVRAAVTGQSILTPAALDAFVTAVYAQHPRYRRRSQHILRALVLTLAGPDFDARDLAEAYLMCIDDLDVADLRQWGIRLADLGHQEITENLSRLLALTGPTILAIDQIDTLLAQSRATAVDGSGGADEDKVLEHIAHGLMSLRQTMSRTASVVACLPTAWEAIERNATASVPDRFRISANLQRIDRNDTSRSIVTKRFAASYREQDFTPPYPTWPIAEPAFATAVDMTPRNLLIAVDNHIRQCLRAGAVSELASFTADVPAPQPQSDDAGVDAVARRFEELRSAADIDPAFASATEDEVLPRLLRAGLHAWIQENPVADGAFLPDPPPSSNPPLHARLRHILNEIDGDEQHFAFRGISATHARSVQSRIDKACSSAGLASGVDRRRLVLIRSTPWPSGAVTARKVADFTAAGGQTLPLSSDDARTLVALECLFEERPPALDVWLDRVRPAHDITLFAQFLPQSDLPERSGEATTGKARADTPSTSPVSSGSGAQGATKRTASEPTLPGLGSLAEERPAGDVPPGNRVAEGSTADSTSARPGANPATVAAPSIPLGRTEVLDETVSVDLEALRKHVAVFAGSGSGKTVLLRRIVEECALQGVSSIVLDINNDLARLGEAWPSQPGGWGPDDAEKARRYREQTDVVVWTPGRQSGNPLVFQPLPRFADVRDDADELRQAQESAFAALAPRARAVGSTAKHGHLEAVLRSAIGWLSTREHPTMDALVDLLEDFPEGMSSMSNEVKLAAEMAENIKAAMVNDPLFAGTGAAVDPGLLLTPPAGKSARISVINLAGLPTDDQKQNFITQLQMALFAWIKKNPAGDTPLRGIYVLDEAQNYVPSGSMTVCKPSTLALVSQARKYGLGMVFATQKPKGLDNSVPGNCDTQFFGKLNAQAQIETVRELARFKGGDVGAIGALKVGNFYLGLGSTPFRRITTPNCLSYHPKSPPTEDEVLEIARATRAFASDADDYGDGVSLLIADSTQQAATKRTVSPSTKGW